MKSTNNKNIGPIVLNFYGEKLTFSPKTTIINKAITQFRNLDKNKITIDELEPNCYIVKSNTRHGIFHKVYLKDKIKDSFCNCEYMINDNNNDDNNNKIIRVCSHILIVKMYKIVTKLRKNIEIPKTENIEYSF